MQESSYCQQPTQQKHTPYGEVKNPVFAGRIYVGQQIIEGDWLHGLQVVIRLALAHLSGDAKLAISCGNFVILQKEAKIRIRNYG